MTCYCNDPSAIRNIEREAVKKYKKALDDAANGSEYNFHYYFAREYQTEDLLEIVKK